MARHLSFSSQWRLETSPPSQTSWRAQAQSLLKGVAGRRALLTAAGLWGWLPLPPSGQKAGGWTEKRLTGPNYLT